MAFKGDLKKRAQLKVKADLIKENVKLKQRIQQMEREKKLLVLEKSKGVKLKAFVDLQKQVKKWKNLYFQEAENIIKLQNRCKQFNNDSL